MADRSGKQLGNYRLLRLLGTGGFAEVYLAEHIFLKTSVAIKLLHAQLETNDMTGFLTEAQTIAHLRHSHIVRVTDFGMDGDLPYLAMEYAPNGTLRQRHPRGTPLSFSTIVPYVKQVADALQYAHNEKLIHRDIKPENMLIGYNNEVLLSDFGIATVAHRTSTQNTSVIAGTAVYMAPELFRGRSYPASDQYALAVVVYEWLSGEPPFYEGDFIQLGYQHTYVPPEPLSEKIATISKDVEHIVNIALAKDPKQRFGSVQAFANAFEQASQANQGYIAPVRPLSKPGLPVPTEEISQANQSYIAPVQSLSQPFPPGTTQEASWVNQGYIAPVPPISTSFPPKPTYEYTSSVDRDVVAIPEETGIEKHGIERVSPATRTHVRIFDNFTMWLSANMVTTTVSIGALAIPVFGLGFWDSLVVIIIFNLLGVLPVAFFATLGPKLGLRQMTISRFSFGWIGAGIMALFNVATCIVVLAVNAIVSGQLVASLSNGAIPSWLGVVIIALLTTLVSVFGYRYIHRYQRYAWLPIAIIFVIMFVLAAPHARMLPSATLGGLGVAALITFGGAVYGFAIGWSSYAADYNVNQPENMSSSRVFWLTFLGVFIPCVLLETLGLLFTTVTATSGSSVTAALGGGDLLAYILKPLGGFSNLLLLLLALSFIANNIPNNYSMGLSMQVIGKAFQRVNRVIWTLIGAIIYIIIAIQASANFELVLSNFLLMIAYWVGPWSIILILEHFVFRHRKYNVDDWNTPARLPNGWAAIVSMALGLFGVYLGAAQVYFVGPIANLFDPPFGMDIGFELGIVFAAISYFFLRRIELNANRK